MTDATTKDERAFEYDLGVVQLRGQPFTVCHNELLRLAKLRCRRLVVMVGSSNRARDFKNPWTYEERAFEMIVPCFPSEFERREMIVVPMPDFHRDNAGWAANVRRLVSLAAGDLAAELGRAEDEISVALSGFKKDGSSFYLDLFPEWGDIRLTAPLGTLNATDVRKAYFADESVILDDKVPAPVAAFLERFRLAGTFRLLVDERKEIDHCLDRYPGRNLTGDILLTHRNKALLVRRGGRYGFGLYAFPGGVREPGEDQLDCSLRELDEETGLSSLNPGLTVAYLKTLVRASLFNDAPGRDLRGDYATTLYHLALPDDMEEPEVEGRDDARSASFVDHASIPSTLWFADHKGMLDEILAMPPTRADA